MGYYKTYGIGNITKKIYLIKICVGSNYRIKMLEKKTAKLFSFQFSISDVSSFIRFSLAQSPGRTPN